MTRFLPLLLLAFVSLGQAQGTLEVIQLRHRTAEQVIPVLRPLVEPGGALSGQYNQLIVRTSPENLAQIRQVLDSIDRPQRRLVVSVRFDNAEDRSRAGVEGGARISNRGVSGNVRIDNTSSAGSESVAQQVQVLEGGEASISTGELRYWSDASTGMIVVPRVNAGGVTLDLYAQQERHIRGGAIQGQRASTTVSGRLGEWIDIGGASSSSASSASGTFGSRESSRSAERRLWLKVEEIR
jgi:hypothetical protein